MWAFVEKDQPRGKLLCVIALYWTSFCVCVLVVFDALMRPVFLSIRFFFNIGFVYICIVRFVFVLFCTISIEGQDRWRIHSAGGLSRNFLKVSLFI